jgi:hypothetical protein
MKFLVEWETDFCDDFPDTWGMDTVKAESEEEARQIVMDDHYHSIVTRVTILD